MTKFRMGLLFAVGALALATQLPSDATSETVQMTEATQLVVATA